MATSLRHSVISGMKWLALTKLLIQLFRWGATFFVIRLLTPEDYGIAAIAGIIPALLSALNFLGVGNAIIRFQEDNRMMLSTLFSVSLMLALLLTALQILSAPWIAVFYETPEVEMMLVVTSVIYLLDCLAVQPKAMLAKELKYAQLARIDLLAGITSPIVVLAFAASGWGYWALAFGLIATSLANLVGCGYYYPIQWRPGSSFSAVRPHVRFGAQNSAASFISQVSNTLDIAIGGYLFNSSQIGVYQVGLQVSMIPLRKISPEMRRISFPAFSKTASDLPRFRHYFLLSMRMVALVVFPLFWGIGLLAEPLVRLVLTDKWVDAIIIIQLISFFLPFRLFNELSNSVANALGRADLVLTNTVVACVSLIIAIGAFSGIGLAGLALAWVVSILLTYLLIVIKLKRQIGFTTRAFLAAVVPPMLGCVVMALSLVAIQHWLIESMVLQLSLLPFIGAAVYAGYIYIFHNRLWRELWHLLRR